VTRSTSAIVLLVLALVMSNLWWAYRLLDTGVTQTYMGAALDDNKQALAQTLALLPVVARPGVSRSEVLAAARSAEPSDVPFEKDGFVWVGKIGLKFNERGQLVEASRAWSPP
jgi:hypothetical protein